MPDANENQKTENQKAESQTGKQVNGDEKPKENQGQDEDHSVNVDDVIDENSEPITPSRELLESLKEIASFDIGADAIQHVEFEDSKKRYWNQLRRVKWPDKFDAIVEKATEKAMNEAKSQVMRISPSCKGWASNTYLLDKGGFMSPSMPTVIIPLIKPSDDPATIRFKDGTGPVVWETKLYLLKKADGFLLQTLTVRCEGSFVTSEVEESLVNVD
ncbi:hypothetical protein PG988_000323 [Apiospora saccharicola]